MMGIFEPSKDLNVYVITSASYFDVLIDAVRLDQNLAWVHTDSRSLALLRTSQISWCVKMCIFTNMLANIRFNDR